MKYTTNQRLLIQRDIRFDSAKSYYDILLHDEVEVDSNEVLMIVSLDNKFYQLNLIGALIIDKVQREHHTKIELVQLIMDMFDLDAEKIKKDVTDFVDFCLNKSIMVIVL